MSTVVTAIDSNRAELRLDDGTIVLASYGERVAARLSNGVYVRTKHKWSRTTGSHITKWLRKEGVDPAGVMEVDQRVLDTLEDWVKGSQ